MKVQLADRLGNLQTKRVGFSWLYFFTGPIYSLCRLKIGIGLIEILLILYLTPIPGMQNLCDLIMKIGFIPQDGLKVICNILMFFRQDYYWVIGIIFCSIFHLFMSFYIDSRVVKRQLKKKDLRPVDEKDARALILYHAANYNIGLADSFDIRSTNNYKYAEENWYEENQNRINHRPSSRIRQTVVNEQTRTVQLEQLKNSYRLGLISELEYKDKFKTIVEKKKSSK